MGIKSSEREARPFVYRLSRHGNVRPSCGLGYLIVQGPYLIDCGNLRFELNSIRTPSNVPYLT